MTNMRNSKITLQPNKIAAVLGTTALILVILSTVIVLADLYNGHSSGAMDKMVKLFYVNLENNAPAFFSMLLLLFVSLLLLVIAILTNKEGRPHVRQWSILSAGFFYMAFDEIAEMHEKLIWPIRAMLGEGRPGMFFFAWVIPAVPLIFFLGLYFLRFLMSLPKKTRFYFLLSGTLFVGGALGLEFLEGIQIDRYGNDNAGFIALTTIEESLEMAANIIFIRALLIYIQETFGEVDFSVN